MNDVHDACHAFNRTKQALLMAGVSPHAIAGAASGLAVDMYISMFSKQSDRRQLADLFTKSLMENTDATENPSQ